MRALRGAFANPLPWAIALGAAFSVAGLVLSGPPEAVVRLLGDSATPVALFTIGAVLARAGRTRTRAAGAVPAGGGDEARAAPAAGVRAGGGRRRLGAPLTAFQVMVLTLTAALPSASNVSMLAERYGADDGRIARIILSSTAAAFVSFTLLAWAFGAQAVR